MSVATKRPIEPAASSSEDLVVPSPFKDDGSFLWGGEWRPAVTGARRQRTKQRAILPTVGDAVTCRVQRINQRLATVDILCVGDVPLRESCAGLIRREDIQVIGSESVEVYRCFRPGDIVLARVISLGDARAYYLTSGDPELGVVLARSQSEGAVMTPVSFKEMECPITKGACASNLRPRPRRSDWTERTTSKVDLIIAAVLRLDSPVRPVCTAREPRKVAKPPQSALDQANGSAGTKGQAQGNQADGGGVDVAGGAPSAKKHRK